MTPTEARNQLLELEASERRAYKAAMHSTKQTIIDQAVNCVASVIGIAFTVSYSHVLPVGLLISFVALFGLGFGFSSYLVVRARKLRRAATRLYDSALSTFDRAQSRLDALDE